MTQPDASIAIGRRRPLRVPTAVRVVLLTVAGLWLVYLVVGNVLLRTRLLRSLLDGDEMRFFVDYGSAWTLVPGRVHVRDLALRIQDDNVQVLLELERVTFQVDPFALASRTFHCTSVRGEGATFRFRHRLAHPTSDGARTAAYPPIPGFADPPIRDPKPDLPIPESEYHLWTVHLDDVSTTVRKLWVMEYRYRGRGSVAGSFQLRPLRELWIDPSVLVTDDGVVALGDDEVLVGSRGRLEVRVEPYDVRVPRGAEILRHVAGRVVLEGDVPDLAPFFRLYAPGAPILVRRGRGRLAIDARLGAGVLAKGARASYATRDVEVDTASGSVAGELSVEAVAAERLGAEATIGSASFLPRGASEVAANARDVHASAALGANDVVKGVALESVTVTLGALDVPDLRGLASLAPDGVRLEGGGATASGHATYREGSLDARIDVGLDRAHARAGSVDLTASGRAWAGFVAADARRHVAIGPCGADLSGATLQVKDTRIDGLWATLRLREAAIRPGAGAGASIHLEAGPGDRTLRLVTGLASLPDIAADAAAGSDLAADLRVDEARGAVTVSLLQAKNGKLDARGRLATARSDTNGAFLVAVGPITAGIEVKGGHASVTPFVRGAWLDERMPP